MKRIQFELPEEKVDELKLLMREIGIKTRKDLFSNALILLEWAIKERRAGRTIASVDEHDNTWREVLMPILSSISK